MSDTCPDSLSNVALTLSNSAGSDVFVIRNVSPVDVHDVRLRLVDEQTNADCTHLLSAHVWWGLRGGDEIELLIEPHGPPVITARLTWMDDDGILCFSETTVRRALW